jgi:hypothetical protein
MIRPVFTEVGLFLAPFVVYAIFLWLTRAGVIDAANWTWDRVVSLTIVSLLLVIGSFVVLSHWSGAPPGSTYVPAHVEDGVLVPGQTTQ